MANTPGYPGVAIVAHRGASAYAPENTMAAFTMAMEMGAKWLELDVRLTSDEAVLVIHDASLDRLAGDGRRVRDLTLDEIAQLDAGSWKGPEFAGERFITFPEVLELAQSRANLLIEIKNDDDDADLLLDMLQLTNEYPRLDEQTYARLKELIEESGTRNLALTRKTVAHIRDAGMTGNAVVQSFSPVICAITRMEAPEMRVEFLGAYRADTPEHWIAYLKFGEFVGVDGYNVKYDSFSKAQLEKLRSLGRSVSVWTVDEPETMRQMAEWGVDRIITNKPDVCMQALEAIGQEEAS